MLVWRSFPENPAMDSIVLHSDVARLVLGESPRSPRWRVNAPLMPTVPSQATWSTRTWGGRPTLCVAHRRTCSTSSWPSSRASRRTTSSTAAWRTSSASTSRSRAWVRLPSIAPCSPLLTSLPCSGQCRAEAAPGDAPPTAAAEAVRAGQRTDDGGGGGKERQLHQREQHSRRRRRRGQHLAGSPQAAAPVTIDFSLPNGQRMKLISPFPPLPRRAHSPVNCLSSPSFSKRPRLLPPHLYCSLSSRDKPKPSFLADDDEEGEHEEETTSSTATDDLEEEPLLPVNGPGPRNNSTPRQGHAEVNPLALTPQTMPVSDGKCDLNECL